MIRALFLLACGPAADTGGSIASNFADRDDTAPGAGDDTAGDTADTGEDCPDGVICVESLPFTERADTRSGGQRTMDAYACAPSTDESGPEIVYRVRLDAESFLGVAIDDPGSGVDVDAHLLASLDPEDCLDRGNSDAGEVAGPGVYYVVADTYVSGGVEQAGEFEITIGAAPLSSGSCEVETGWIDRVGDGGVALAMPATGPMALEAHLVTVDDGYGTGVSDPWPASITENIEAHYALSQGESGFVMWRGESWAPQESSQYGQGSHGAKLPVEDEAWYVNMYWSDRPDAGTRMILRRSDGRAAVVAGGYETGPGDLSYIGGVVEEVHHYMGTTHGGEMTLGFAVDQSLPLGPIRCD